MRPTRLIAPFVLALGLTQPAFATMHQGNGKTNAKAEGGLMECPPGLSKKNPACVPPGIPQNLPGVKDGDRIPDAWTRVSDPARYGLDSDETYYRVGDTIVRVNRDTAQVLDIMGSVAELTN